MRWLVATLVVLPGLLVLLRSLLALPSPHAWRPAQTLQPATSYPSLSPSSSALPRKPPDALAPPHHFAPNASAASPPWMDPPATNLRYNAHARARLSAYHPSRTTLHFTFGSAVMIDFVRNWLHFAQKAGLTPYVVGASDSALMEFCEREGVSGAALNPQLDVWTYELKKLSHDKVYEMKSSWQYFRHHNSDFLEMGLVKVAFLWELLYSGFDVLISDLDVVWLNDGWKRWMTWRDPKQQPVPEAALIAFADVLVSTDELNTEADLRGTRASELNTGVVYFRAGAGALAMVQQWRQRMLGLSRARSKSALTENDNDQSLFNQIVHGVDVTRRFQNDFASLLRNVGVSESSLPFSVTDVAQRTRRVYSSDRASKPCLPSQDCDAIHFTFATLPVRPFSSGHMWFNQGVQTMPGHELPQHQPVNVHFTFQFGDTRAYPHGKRQRAREAGLWAVDPPEYFTEGVYIALTGPAYTKHEEEAIYRRFPEWSPQRHMFLDAPQRQAVRDLLGLASTFDGVTILPKFYCHCDRYWNFLSKCRIPFIVKMPLPFSCPMDSLYLTDRWNDKGIRYREHTFLSNQNVPRQLRENRVLLTVAEKGATPRASNSTLVEVAYGTALNEVKDAVLQANPGVRVVEVSAPHLRRLCKWLGSTQKQRDFNNLMRYILTESSRYCPNEDHGRYGGMFGAWNWQNPFTAYNCTWGFRAPVDYPEERSCGADGVAVALPERDNSTTCPRQMLCDHNVDASGRVTREITRCNIEGYNGMDARFRGAAAAMLKTMPGGRCPYPPGTEPGPGPGFDARGHYVGLGS